MADCLLASSVLNEKFEFPSPRDTVRANTVTKYIVKGVSPVTLTVVTLVEILKSVTPVVLSIKSKMYPRMIPLGISGAFQVMRAYVELISVAVTFTGALGAT